MDGIHDMGGMHGFGSVPIREEDYTFRYDWQRRSFGLAQALAGATPYCADMHRHKIEQLPATDYLRMDYFEKWAIATSRLLEDAGLVDAEELRTGMKRFDVDLQKHPSATPDGLVAAMMAGVDLTYPEGTCSPTFAVGDPVRVSADCPAGHTRVPRYVRTRPGLVIADMGVFQFADTIAAGKGPKPQHCYTVMFTAESLWGTAAERPGDRVYMDLAEDYLEHP